MSSSKNAGEGTPQSGIGVVDSLQLRIGLEAVVGNFPGGISPFDNSLPSAWRRVQTGILTYPQHGESLQPRAANAPCARGQTLGNSRSRGPDCRRVHNIPLPSLFAQMPVRIRLS
jgi:hypothetical protein